jgi:hypothetical protein
LEGGDGLQPCRCFTYSLSTNSSVIRYKDIRSVGECRVQKWPYQQGADFGIDFGLGNLSPDARSRLITFYEMFKDQNERIILLERRLNPPLLVQTRSLLT